MNERVVLQAAEALVRFCLRKLFAVFLAFHHLSAPSGISKTFQTL